MGINSQELEIRSVKNTSTKPIPDTMGAQHDPHRKGPEMAKGTEVDTVTQAPQVVGYDDTGVEWENVKEESPDQITLDVLGDTLIAVYKGTDIIEFENNKGEPQSFKQHRLRLPGGPAVLNGSYELDAIFEKMPIDTMFRLQLLKLVDTGQQSPMKSYRVDTAKPPVE